MGRTGRGDVRGALLASVALLLLAPSAVEATTTASTSAAAVALAEEPGAACVNPSTDLPATPISTAWGTVGVFNDTTQLFPAQLGGAFFADHGASDARACLARNSFGAFQVAVTAAAGPATIQGVVATDLTGPGGAVLSAQNVRFYREGIVSLVKLSDASFRTDLLPRNAAGECIGDCRMFDALVPTVEPVTGAPRSAYPEVVPAHETRVVWVDVLAPHGQVAGAYEGTVTLQVNGSSVPVPLTVQVVDKTIPSPGSAQAAAQGTDLTSEFRLRSAGGMNWSKFATYARLGLENRISVWRDGSPGMSQVEWDQVSPLLEGTDPGVRLPGAQLQNVAVTKYTSAADLTSLRTRLAAIGQVDKAWFWCDEVAVSTCATDVAAARSTWPTLPLVAIPKLGATHDPLTHPQGAEGDLHVIDDIRGLVPLSTYLHPQAGKAGLNPYSSQSTEDRSPAFASWRDAAAGREFWTYISCMSEGCGATYTPQGVYSGWPSYAIDHAGSTQSALGWHAFRYGITAEHYWGANFCANATAGAQLDACLYTNDDGAGSNGDGNLFYRSTQFGLGGTEIPLETIRLKRIRDGRQAYALLTMRQASHGDATSFVTGIYPEMGSSHPTAQAYDAARGALLVAGEGAVAMTAPRNVVARAGNAQATVTWDPPTTLPGTFMNYVVFANGAEVGSTMGETELTVSGLENGTPYVFTVYAETTYGISPGGTSNEVTPSSQRPVPPTDVNAVADDGQATISWSAPPAQVGVLEEYVVRTHEGATACTATDTDCTAAGLTNGKTYTFTVTAVTSAGESNPSAPSPAVTPQLPQIENVTPPSIPTSPRYAEAVEADPGSWTGRWGPDHISVDYRWRRDGQVIAGATSRTYRPTRADVGTSLRVEVTASGPGYRPLTEVSAPRQVGRAVLSIRETAATRAKRLHGVVRGRDLTLTFRLGAAANGGKARAVLAGSTVGSARVASGRLVITLHTARASGLARGSASFAIRYGRTAYAEATSRRFSLRIR